MPVHDWSRIDLGLYHYVHRNWYRFLRAAIARQVSPAEYDVRMEKRTALFRPEEALQHRGDRGDVPRSIGVVEPERYFTFGSTLTVRRRHGDQLVAIVDIIPPGDRSWVDERLREAVAAGVHLLMIDAFEKRRSLSDEVPLHLNPDTHVLLPLNATYTRAVYSIPSVSIRDVPFLAPPAQTSTDE